MFTSEPSLAQRIERMIGDVPIVDARSYLDPHRLGAPDLAALIAEPPLRRVLVGVGMPPDSFDPGKSPEERVALALPSLRRARNTAAAWCFYRLCRDLYDFDEPHLTAENVGDLADRVARSGADPAWGLDVLRRRAGIRFVVTPVPAAGSDRADPLPGLVRHRLDLVGTAPADVPAEVVRVGVFEELDGLLDDRARFAGFAALPDVANPVHAAALRWHDLHGLPLQVVVAPSRDAADALPTIGPLVRAYPNVRFAFLSDDFPSSLDIAGLAATHPHVFAGGTGAPGSDPFVAEQATLARVRRAGMTKLGGFSSEATSAEWVYGAFQATRKLTAAALAHAVAGGSFEEDELPPLLRTIFDEAPAAWYRLDD